MDQGGWVTEAEVLDILEGRYATIRYGEPDGQWAFFRHLYTEVCGGYGARTMDAWAMNCWESTGFRKIAFEVKVSRSDFLRELKDPRKREPAMKVSHQFYFVAPAGMIRRSYP